MQINTHIVTMTAYAATMGALLYHLFQPSGGYKTGTRLLTGLVVLSWFAALNARPVYYMMKAEPRTVTLTLPRVSGMRVTPEEAATLNSLASFVWTHVEPNQYLYIGNHRHESMVENDKLAYFMLNRPIPVRYHDLHPGVADVSKGQREMIGDLESKQPPYIILKHVLDDATLDRVVAGFRVHVPEIGAQDLDRYIASHYEKTVSFGPYDVWKRISSP